MLGLQSWLRLRIRLHGSDDQKNVRLFFKDMIEQSEMQKPHQKILFLTKVMHF